MDLLRVVAALEDGQLPGFYSFCGTEWLSLRAEESCHVHRCISDQEVAPRSLCFFEYIAHSNQLYRLIKFFISDIALMNGSA